MTDEEVFARVLTPTCKLAGCSVRIIDRCACGMPVTKVEHNVEQHWNVGLETGELPISASATYDRNCSGHDFQRERGAAGSKGERTT